MATRASVRSANKIHQPDTLDNRIVRELGSPGSFQQWNVRESYASIAKRLGVDEETVRKRIKRAERAGAIQGWRVLMHPNTLGLVDTFLDLDVNNPGRKTEVLAQIRVIDSVVIITNFEDRGLFILLYSEPGDALARKLELIRTICGADQYDAWTSLLPACDLKLSRTDWQIVWTMRNDPRKNISQIAKEVGISTRTVNRRLRLLTERRAMFLVGLPGFRQVAGMIGNFLISPAQAGNMSSVLKSIVAHFPNITFQAVYSSGMMCNIFFHNLSEAEGACDWIKKLDGVGMVRMRILKDLILVSDWLDAEIKKRLSVSLAKRFE